MRLLVTGASGFVGGKLADRAEVHGGFEILRMGRRALPTIAGYRAIDLRHVFDFPSAVDVVVHAAARSSPWGTRREFWSHNVDATQNVIDACERAGRPRLIYISSGSVFYRDEHQLGLTEQSPIGPRFVNTYAASKAAAEEIVRSYAGSWTILRPRAVFGAGDTVLFPRILKAAQQGRLPHFVTDGTPVRGDLIGIDALSDYILAAARNSQLTGEFNLTNNEPVPIIDFLHGILERLGMPRPTRRVPIARAMAFARMTEGIYRALPFLGEPPITRFGVGVFAYSKVFDVSKSLAALGPPSVSLARGVEDFLAWQAPQLARMK